MGWKSLSFSGKTRGTSALCAFVHMRCAFSDPACKCCTYAGLLQPPGKGTNDPQERNETEPGRARRKGTRTNHRKGASQGKSVMNARGPNWISSSYESFQANLRFPVTGLMSARRDTSRSSSAVHHEPSVTAVPVVVVLVVVVHSLSTLDLLWSSKTNTRWRPLYITVVVAYCAKSCEPGRARRKGTRTNHRKGASPGKGTNDPQERILDHPSFDLYTVMREEPNHTLYVPFTSVTRLRRTYKTILCSCQPTCIESLLVNILSRWASQTACFAETPLSTD